MTMTTSAHRQLCVTESWNTVCGNPTFTLVDGEPMCRRCRQHRATQKDTQNTPPEELEMPHLDATPDNTNDEFCETCKAHPGMPCLHFTNPPIARDRMHYIRVEAAQRTAARKKREAKGKPHDIALALMQATDTRTPVVALLTVTDAAGTMLHRYELSEHDFMLALRGSVVQAVDLMDES